MLFKDIILCYEFTAAAINSLIWCIIYDSDRGNRSIRRKTFPTATFSTNNVTWNGLKMGTSLGRGGVTRLP